MSTCSANWELDHGSGALAPGFFFVQVHFRADAERAGTSIDGRVPKEDRHRQGDVLRPEEEVHWHRAVRAIKDNAEPTDTLQPELGWMMPRGICES